MAQLSKTAALKAATKTVTSISRRGDTDYILYVDCELNSPFGGSMEVRASSYPDAVLKRSTWLALNALELMGKLDHESQAAVHAQANDSYESHIARAMLETGLKNFGTDPTVAQLDKANHEYWRDKGVKNGYIEP